MCTNRNTSHELASFRCSGYILWLRCKHCSYASKYAILRRPISSIIHLHIVEEEAWRWQVASACIPAFALLWGTIFICWDSPRYLMKKERTFQKRYDDTVGPWIEGQHEQPIKRAITLPMWLYGSRLLPGFLRRFFEPSMTRPYRSPAFQTLLLLREEPILAVKELLFAHCQLLIELLAQEPPLNRTQLNEDMDFSLRSRSGWVTRILHLFARKGSQFAYIRREAIAAACVMLSQQLCGINVLIFYSSTIFCNAGSGQEDSASLKPLYLSLTIGFFNFICAFPAYRWIETRGRQWLLLATLPLTAATIGIAAAGSSLSQEDHPAAVSGTVITFTILFTAIYSFGLGPVPFTYSAEIFPVEHRMVGMSWAVSINLLGAGLLALFVPKITKQWLLLTIFAVLNIVAFLGVWRYAPEVKGTIKGRDGRTHMVALDLEQLFHIFRMPNWVHQAYQKEVFFPYFWRSILNVVLFRGKPDLDDSYKPFYIWGQQLWDPAERRPVNARSRAPQR